MLEQIAEQDIGIESGIYCYYFVFAVEQFVQ